MQFHLDPFLNINLQPNDFGQNTVGRRQDVICSLYIPPDVDPYNAELGWLYKDDIISDDNRVTINSSNNHFNDSTLVTSIQFDPVIEEDKDKDYICYALMNGSLIIQLIDFYNFTSKTFFVYIQIYTDVCIQI